MFSTGGTPALAHSMQPRRLVLGRQALPAVLDGPVDAGVAASRTSSRCQATPASTSSGGQIAP